MEDLEKVLQDFSKDEIIGIAVNLAIKAGLDPSQASKGGDCCPIGTCGVCVSGVCVHCTR